jgi:hypothetical protein
MPKLKIKSLLESPVKEDICEVEEVRDRFEYGPQSIVVVEGTIVNSYDELVKMAEQNREKEFLEVTVLPVIEGG